MDLNIVLTGLLTGAVAGFIVLAGVLFVYFKQKRSIIDQFMSFITPPDDKTPSQLAIFVDQLAFVFSQRVVQQLKTTVMGMNSVDAKNEQREAVAAALEKSPALAAAVNLIPGARRLMKNPALLGALTNALSAAGKGGGNHKPPAEIKSQFPL